MENNTIHKTSKGKIFQMVGANGKPIDYAENRHYFKRNDLAMLEVGQALKHKESGIRLIRLK